jgi:hypothetical protein
MRWCASRTGRYGTCRRRRPAPSKYRARTAKSGLNKAILDQGWCEFRRQLDYKVAWRGGYLVAVPPPHTSRRCPCCGPGSANDRPTQGRRAWIVCGFEEHAARVGAVNVSRAGYARFACEVTGAVRPSGSSDHRSDLATRSMPAPGAVGIAVLYAGEEVNEPLKIQQIRESPCSARGTTPNRNRNAARSLCLPRYARQPRAEGGKDG